MPLLIGDYADKDDDNGDDDDDVDDDDDLYIYELL